MTTPVLHYDCKEKYKMEEEIKTSIIGGGGKRT